MKIKDKRPSLYGKYDKNTSINRRKSVEYRNNSLEHSSPAHKKRRIT